MANPIYVDSRKALQGIQVVVRFEKEMRIRLWIALRLIKLGCLIGMFDVDIKDMQDGNIR
jgi:diacylglycerol kinase